MRGAPVPSIAVVLLLVYCKLSDGGSRARRSVGLTATLHAMSSGSRKQYRLISSHTNTCGGNAGDRLIAV
jgi:hypothetical protein